MAGTYVVNKGITDSATWTTVAGFIVGLVPLVWSYFRHAQPPGSSPSPSATSTSPDTTNKTNQIATEQKP